MGRLDRLYAIAEELRRAGPRGRTSEALARRFEVSPRTIKRDIFALQQAGVPIWAQPGPGGGYVLDAGRTLPPVNLTPAQAVAVAVALAAHRGGPFAVDGSAALDKLMDVMDDESRRRAEQIAGRVWVRGAGEAGAAAPVLRAIEDAVTRGMVVSIAYAGADGATTRRRVDPMMLAHTERAWYLVAWCRRRRGVRWFRLDRITAAHVTKQRVVERDLALIGAPPADARPVSRAGVDNP